MVAPLSVSNSDIKVYNAALARLGVSPVSSFLESSSQARIGNSLYADALEAALSSYPWRFARDRIVLAGSTTDAPAPWSGLFVLPSRALVVHTIFEDDQKVLFDVFGRNVAIMTPNATAGEIVADVTTMVGPDQWPGYFREAFIMKLAADVAMPLTQDEKTAAFADQKAENLMMRARSRDAQGRTPSKVDTSLFIRARRGGYRR